MISLPVDSVRDEEFEKYLFAEDIGLMRNMLIMGILLYSAFGIIDRMLYIEELKAFTMIRFGIVIPVIFIVFLLSYHKSFYKLHQFLLTVMFTIAGIGIVVMLILAPMVNSYYGGLFLIFGYAYFLIRLKWQFAAVGSSAIMITYYILAFVHLGDYLNDALIFSLFYLSFLLIAGLSGYTFSTYRFHRYNEEKLLKGDKVILESKNYDNLIDIEASNHITIYSIAKLAESRDKFTGNHIERVGKLSLKLAKKIHIGVYLVNDCDKDRVIRSIELASTLHDIGKIAIPEHILMKSSKFTVEEMEVMKKHCMLGSSTLREIQNEYAKNDFVNMGINICESHHENWDGSGYPRRLKGKDIPFAARIVSVIDVYDALISERPYKKGWSVEKSRAEIKRLSGIKFDPEVVSAFLKI